MHGPHLFFILILTIGTINKLIMKINISGYIVFSEFEKHHMNVSISNICPLYIFYYYIYFSIKSLTKRLRDRSKKVANNMLYRVL
jgi:hypothetical protein